MAFLDIPFTLRVALLLAFGLVIAGVDLRQHGRSATRWREYALLFAMATIGGFCGFSTDLITSSISPEYFIVGKGLPSNENLRTQAMLLGAQAGFSAGAILACALLFVNSMRPRNESLSCNRLLRHISKPILIALAFAILLAMIARLFIAAAQRSDLRFVLTSEQIPGFITVWAVHAGIYLGAVVGTIWAARAIWRARKLAGDKTKSE